MSSRPRTHCPRCGAKLRIFMGDLRCPTCRHNLNAWLVFAVEREINLPDPGNSTLETAEELIWMAWVLGR